MCIFGLKIFVIHLIYDVFPTNIDNQLFLGTIGQLLYFKYNYFRNE